MQGLLQEAPLFLRQERYYRRSLARRSLRDTHTKADGLWKLPSCYGFSYEIVNVNMFMYSAGLVSINAMWRSQGGLRSV